MNDITIVVRGRIGDPWARSAREEKRVQCFFFGALYMSVLEALWAARRGDVLLEDAASVAIVGIGGYTVKIASEIGLSEEEIAELLSEVSELQDEIFRYVRRNAAISLLDLVELASMMGAQLLGDKVVPLEDVLAGALEVDEETVQKQYQEVLRAIRKKCVVQGL